MKNQEKVKTAIDSLVASLAAANEWEAKQEALQAQHAKEVADLQEKVTRERAEDTASFHKLNEAVRDAKLHLKKTMHAVYGDNESQVFYKIAGGFVQFKLTKEGELKISNEIPGDVLA